MEEITKQHRENSELTTEIWEHIDQQVSNYSNQVADAIDKHKNTPKNFDDLKNAIEMEKSEDVKSKILVDHIDFLLTDPEENNLIEKFDNLGKLENFKIEKKDEKYFFKFNEKNLLIIEPIDSDEKIDSKNFNARQFKYDEHKNITDINIFNINENEKEKKLISSRKSEVVDGKLVQIINEDENLNDEIKMNAQIRIFDFENSNDEWKDKKLISMGAKNNCIENLDNENFLNELQEIFFYDRRNEKYIPIKLNKKIKNKIEKFENEIKLNKNFKIILDADGKNYLVERILPFNPHETEKKISNDREILKKFLQKFPAIKKLKMFSKIENWEKFLYETFVFNQQMFLESLDFIFSAAEKNPKIKNYILENFEIDFEKLNDEKYFLEKFENKKNSKLTKIENAIRENFEIDEKEIFAEKNKNYLNPIRKSDQIIDSQYNSFGDAELFNLIQKNKEKCARTELFKKGKYTFEFFATHRHGGIVEINSENGFDYKISELENFLDENFLVFKNADGAKNFLENEISKWGTEVNWG